jgi:hypothetical protein
MVLQSHTKAATKLTAPNALAPCQPYSGVRRGVETWLTTGRRSVRTGIIWQIESVKIVKIACNAWFDMSNCQCHMMAIL